MIRSALLMVCLGTSLCFASASAQSSKRALTTDTRVLKAVEGTPVSVSGQYRTLVEDYADRAPRTRHLVRTPQGEVEVRLTDAQSARLIPGQSIKVSGRVEDGAVQATSTPLLVSASTAALPNTLGEQRVAAILVKYQDDPTEPMTRAQVHDLVFGTVNNFYQASSFGQAWLTGEVFDYITVPYNRADCTDAMFISNFADQELINRGVNLSSFGRKLYLWPKNGCSWTGLALVGETPSMGWINGSFTLKAVGHELGHGFGLRHAHALECSPAPTGPTCSRYPYGDSADLMGNVRTGDFSAYAKERLGWLGDGVSPDIHTASQSGRYIISPYAASGVSAKAVRIPRGLDEQGRPLYFYMEHRWPVGVDTVLAGVGNLGSGLMVRSVIHGDGDSIHLLDMTPDSNLQGDRDLSDGALGVGMSYTDPISSATIQVVSADEMGAVVDVSYPYTPPPPSCSFQHPQVSVVANTASATVGQSLSYSVIVANLDDPNNPACAARDFRATVAIEGPSVQGLATSITPVGLSLLPGQQGQYALTVASQPSSVPGDYLFRVQVASNETTPDTVEDAGSFLPPCTPTAPSWATVSAPASGTAGSTLNYTYTLTNHDNAQCAASVFSLSTTQPSGWTAWLTPQAVQLAPGASAQVFVQVKSTSKTKPGTYAWSLSASRTGAPGSTMMSSSSIVRATSAGSASKSNAASAYRDLLPLVPGATHAQGGPR